MCLKLNKNDHKKLFYAIQSNKLSDIKDAYTSDRDNSQEVLTTKEWIADFARYIQSLKNDNWHNSFDDLPDGKKA